MNTPMLNYSAFKNFENRSDHRDRTVESIDNHIYFYADVEAETVFDLLREVREIDANLQDAHHSHDLDAIHYPAVPIWLHIQSYGGSLFAGFSTADHLKRVKSPIYSIVEGVCASAATLMAVSCAKRYISPNSFMLIHQISGSIWGTHEQFKDEMRLQEMAMERLVRFYTVHTPNSAETIREMLAHDTWMDAERCLEQGFVDAILETPVIQR